MQLSPEVFATITGCQALQSLSFSNVPHLTDEIFTFIVKKIGFRLTNLQLESLGLTDESILGISEHCENLMQLRILNCDQWESLNGLVTSSKLKRLSKLVIHDCSSLQANISCNHDALMSDIKTSTLTSPPRIRDTSYMNVSTPSSPALPDQIDSPTNQTCDIAVQLTHLEIIGCDLISQDSLFNLLVHFNRLQHFIYAGESLSLNIRKYLTTRSGLKSKTGPNIRLLFGTMFSWLSLFLTSFLDVVPSADLCFGIFAAETIGFSIVFGALTIKTLRIVQYLRVKSVLPKLNDFVLLKYLVIYVVGWIFVILMFKTFSDSGAAQILTFESSSNSQSFPISQIYYGCDYGGLEIVKCLYQGLSIAIGLTLTIMLSKATTPYNEGLWMSRAMYNYVFSYIMSFALYEVASKYEFKSRVVAHTASIVGTQLVTLLMLTVPKLLHKSEQKAKDKSLGSNSSIATIKVEEPAQAAVKDVKVPIEVVNFNE
ncbi:hypothetical protein HDV04_001475 [Boothiomyces sp. JEL0838]|nr:hypothetical protein HDV04_001475 [Boothiomyces sp. JEL0838]